MKATYKDIPQISFVFLSVQIMCIIFSLTSFCYFFQKFLGTLCIEKKNAADL